MRSNLYDVLKLVDGVIQAGGPVEWDDGESQAVLTVIIKQEAQIAGVASTESNLDRSEETWNLAVPPALPEMKFKPGIAYAASLACPLGEGAEGPPFQWSQEVTLEE
jgi:hypothetical protein